MVWEMLRRKSAKQVVKGLVTPMRSVPKHIAPPEYSVTGKPHKFPAFIRLYEPHEYDKLRASGRLAREILEYTLSLAKPGVTTEEIDILCHEEIIKRGAYPSPINYMGFPKAMCSSVNEVVCHGIPDDRPLENGDILSIDISVYMNGYHGDNCGTVIVGESNDPQAEKLVQVTKRALETAISKIGPGVCLTTIGNTIEDIANKNTFSVVKEFVGHGTGAILHMPPYVNHVRNKEILELKEGMVFTIEPILVEGSPKINIWDDGWTVVTQDLKRGAQFEHEVLITKNGVEVLTIC